MFSEKEFMSRYFDIKQRLATEEIQHPLVWPNEDWSKLIYGTEDEKTRRMMSELASDMEDTGGWIVKALFKDYPEDTETVEIAGFGQWKIDFPSQLYAFLKVKRENLVSDRNAKWIKVRKIRDCCHWQIYKQDAKIRFLFRNIVTQKTVMQEEQ